MKYLLCLIAVIALSTVTMAQDNPFMAVGPRADLFAGADVLQTTFVSTQAEAFTAVAPVQDHVAPVDVPAPPVKTPVQAPKQAPMNVQAPVVHYHQSSYRTAPVRRQWFRFGNRRARGGVFRGWFGGC